MSGKTRWENEDSFRYFFFFANVLWAIFIENNQMTTALLFDIYNEDTIILTVAMILELCHNKSIYSLIKLSGVQSICFQWKH